MPGFSPHGEIIRTDFWQGSEHHFTSISFNKCVRICKMHVKFSYPGEIAPVTCLAFTDWENWSLERTEPIASSVLMTKTPRSCLLLGQSSVSNSVSQGKKTNQLLL